MQKVIGLVVPYSGRYIFEIVEPYAGCQYQDDAEYQPGRKGAEFYTESAVCPRLAQNSGQSPVNDGYADQQQDYRRAEAVPCQSQAFHILMSEVPQ